MGSQFKSINIQSFLKMKAIFLLLAGVALVNAAPASDSNQLSYIENLIARIFYGGLQGCQPPCINGGICQEDDTCDCPEFDTWKFQGEACEIGPCSPAFTPEPYHCFNGGNCHEDTTRPDGAECICTTTCPDCYDGQHCEFLDQCKIDLEEDGSSCSDHGFCTNDYSEAGFICLCENGWMGQKCEKVDLCFPNPCLNDGLCVQLNETITECECKDGYFGEFCENADLCRVYPCYNGGTCSLDEQGQPQCECSPHYEGDQCQDEISCDPPCLNGGSCGVDRLGRKSCYCPPGYTGKQCEHSACSPSPCFNGGTCTIKNGFPHCDCYPGYSGEFCEDNACKTEKPECNHGNCVIDEEGNAGCECYPGWAPPDCKEQTTDVPTKPTENPTEPTEVPTEPTEPTENPTEPTEVPTEPTEPSVVPTETTTKKKFTKNPKDAQEPLRFHRTS